MTARSTPPAEVDITPELVRALLAEQHPDLAALPIEPLASGWDNVMLRLGGTLIARLPRRAWAAGFLTGEQRWLPELAPRLPLPVPAPVAIGRPGCGYPWPWSVVPYLPGRAAAEEPPADPHAAAVTLAGFLGALHRPAPPDAPVSPSRGIPLAERAPLFAENLAVLDGATAGAVDRPAIAAVWNAAQAAPPWDGPPLWLHGDLHPGNILVDGGRISGVVDFGDLTAGDPAADLAVAWMLLPLAGRESFRAAYHTAGGLPPGDPVWTRAHGWAADLAVMLLAHSADNPRLHRIGATTLRAALA